MTEEAAKAAEAARQEKEKARLDAIAGLSAEQISKAEELANWDFIKDSKEEPDYRDHLARFPQGVTLRMARTRLETILWAKLGFTPTADALEGFLALVSRRSPRGGSREVAREAEGRDREAAHARAQKGRAHANTDGRAGTAAGVDAEGLDHDRRARGRFVAFFALLLFGPSGTALGPIVAIGALLAGAALVWRWFGRTRTSTEVAAVQPLDERDMIVAAPTDELSWISWAYAALAISFDVHVRPHRQRRGHLRPL